MTRQINTQICQMIPYKTVRRRNLKKNRSGGLTFGKHRVHGSGAHL